MNNTISKIVLNDETLYVEDTKARESIKTVEEDVKTSKKDISTAQSDIKTTKNDISSLNEQISGLTAKVQECFQLASNLKRKVAEAITGKGVKTSATDSADTMASNIKKIQTGIDTSDGTIVASDVLEGKIAYSKNSKVTGSMPNLRNRTTALCGYESIKVEPHPADNSQALVTIENAYGTYGYIDTSSKFTCNMSNLSANNIRSGVVVGRFNDVNNSIIGTFTSDANATADKMISGYTAYVNGNKVSGNIADRGVYSGACTSAVTWENRVYLRFYPGYYHGGNYDGNGGQAEAYIQFSDLAALLGINANAILSGYNFCGVSGTAISGKPYVTRTATIYGETLNAQRYLQLGWGEYWRGVSENYNVCYFTLDGLGFTPSVIRITVNVMNQTYNCTMFNGQVFCIMECGDGMSSNRFGSFNTKEAMFAGTKVYLPVSSNFLTDSSYPLRTCTYTVYDA